MKLSIFTAIRMFCYLFEIRLSSEIRLSNEIHKTKIVAENNCKKKRIQ